MEEKKEAQKRIQEERKREESERRKVELDRKKHEAEVNAQEKEHLAAARKEFERETSEWLLAQVSDLFNNNNKTTTTKKKQSNKQALLTRFFVSSFLQQQGPAPKLDRVTKEKFPADWHPIIASIKTSTKITPLHPKLVYMTTPVRLACKGLVEFLISDENSWPFLHPVDPIALGLDDYFRCGEVCWFSFSSSETVFNRIRSSQHCKASDGFVYHLEEIFLERISSSGGIAERSFADVRQLLSVQPPWV